MCVRKRSRARDRSRAPGAWHKGGDCSRYFSRCHLSSSTHFEPNEFPDVTEAFPRKVAALRAHASQTGHMDDLEGMLRGWMTRTAQAAGLPEGRLAEAFQAIQIR